MYIKLYIRLNNSLYKDHIIVNKFGIFYQYKYFTNKYIKNLIILSYNIYSKYIFLYSIL